MKPINPEKTSQNIVIFIKNIFKRENFTSAVVALSGGIDSSVSCVLTARALGKNNVFPILLPYGRLNLQGVVDAFKLIDLLGIPKRNIIQVDIKTSVDEITKIDSQIDPIRKGNIMARVRMAFIFDQAKKRKALVIGTENRSEHLLGYFTRFGDEASDIEPIRSLYKTQVYQLAKFLNLPESILIKNPTAGLWENQTDENEFGFTYNEADQILYYYFDKKSSFKKIIAKGLKRDIVLKVLKFAKKNGFKHNLPFVINKNPLLLKEQIKQGFLCSHCHKWVSTSKLIGTRHRNHCPSCLWSKHVDLEKAGDRKASCTAGMKPIGLTFKQARADRYGRPYQGELMLIHYCTNKDCGKISINRIAGDDTPEAVLGVFEESQMTNDDLKKEVAKMGINLLTKSDEKQIKTQLFGKS